MSALRVSCCYANNTMQGAPSSYVRLPDVDLLRKKWVGVPVTALPTPAVLIDRYKMLANIAEMQKTMTDWQCLFRAHIKTHKTREGVCHQLAQSKQRAIVVSTFAEAWGVVESGLLDEGVVDDVSGRRLRQTMVKAAQHSLLPHGRSFMGCR